MLKKMKLFLMLLAGLAGILTACGTTPPGVRPPASGAEGEGAAPLTVTVSVLPQQYLVERIGGEWVRVNVMVEPGASPHSYEPKPQQMRDLSESAVYFSIGVEFEDAWLERIAAANNRMRIVDMAANIEKVELPAHDHDHTAGELDPHVWTSPALVKTMSHTIYETLTELDPNHEADYRANRELFIKDIEDLQEQISASLLGLENKRFMVFHPSWGYFAREFGLEQISIEVGGQEPSAQELAGLVDRAQFDQIKVVFAQPEFSTRAAQVIAREIGGKVLLISPLEYDWLENLRSVAETFSQVLAN